MPIHSPLSRAALCSGPSGLPPAPLPIGRRFLFSSHNKYLCPERSYNNPPRKFKIPKKTIVLTFPQLKNQPKSMSILEILSQLLPIFCLFSVVKHGFSAKNKKFYQPKALFAKMLQLIRMENSNSLSLYARLPFNKKILVTVCLIHPDQASWQ